MGSTRCESLLDRLPRPPLIWPAVAQMSKLGPVALTTTPGALADVIDHSWPRSGAEDLVQNDSAPAVRTLSSEVSCPQSTELPSIELPSIDERRRPCRQDGRMPGAAGSNCVRLVVQLGDCGDVPPSCGERRAWPKPREQCWRAPGGSRFTSVYFGLLRFTLAPSETECGSRLH